MDNQRERELPARPRQEGEYDLQGQYNKDRRKEGKGGGKDKEDAGASSITRAQGNRLFCLKKEGSKYDLQLCPFLLPSLMRNNGQLPLSLDMQEVTIPSTPRRQQLLLEAIPGNRKLLCCYFFTYTTTFHNDVITLLTPPMSPQSSLSLLSSPALVCRFRFGF